MGKYLVTGASGFIGTALLEKFSENGDEVIAVVRENSENIGSIKNRKNFKIVFCDMKNVHRLSELIEERNIDACVHLAWQGSTGQDRADYGLQLQNVQFSVNLVKEIQKMKIKRFVSAGTLAEMDVLNYSSLDGATPNIVSHYGTAKIAANYMTKAECSNAGIEHIWCYISNTYGEGNQTNNFINFASKLMLSGKRAAFTSGEQMYDFVYVKDTARALMSVVKNGKKNTSYYLGSTEPRKLKEYIKIIRDTVDPSMELYMGEIPFNGVELPADAFSSGKLIKDTGYMPMHTFENTIGQTIEWLRGEMNK